MNGAQLLCHRACARAALVSLLIVTSILVSLSTARAASPDDGKAVFQQKCQACHSIGKGRLVGPDLLGVTSRRDRTWLLDTIIAPDRLIAQGDATAKQLVQEFGMPMPNLGISIKDAEAILGYLDSLGNATAGSQATAAQPANAAVSQQAPPAVTTGGSPAQGRAIFTGETGLANGGLACVSCHSVRSTSGLGGGSLAKDLTMTYKRLGQDGLAGSLKAAPFPIMKEAFSNHPLTGEEVANLIAFLRQESETTGSDANPLLFPAFALAVFVVVMGFLLIISRGRLQGVRQGMLKGGTR